MNPQDIPLESAAHKPYKTVLLFGAPGAGKGTQGKILARIPGFYHCSCGDVFRNMDLTSDLGRMFVDYSSRGELVPDEVTVKMWARAIRARAFLGDFKPSDDILILDGIPRTLQQARLMDEHVEVIQVIHLTCSDEAEMVRRLRRRAIKENRRDDADEAVIRSRWRIYQEETAPVLRHYEPSMIREVDAMGSPAQVLGSVLDHVVPAQDAHFAADREGK
ncbi:adenylate kinase family protein [Phycisphaera mikurensis]|uniref:Adenylate kinase n=1 Tax=Phycisphaera mikurensis (strain NBRC 102666 / KCTC 22515 / FYK2301M01) TaxID=1142394 RepID=I0IDE7_PHYMF|nr:nucleoside monophosphate kinase [Phycisphaera mikurensis]MBB6443329.1 adenylate kinase [Phycisphaera mikurensis]BAM03285.1 adenylate kinase [Phycisphaera mikurensis NBRC 102666]